MNETTWVGPKGSTIIINNGSGKPPRWALLLIDRVLYRSMNGSIAGRRRSGIRLRWTKGNGGGYYYPSLRTITLHLEGHSPLYSKSVVMHELAHALDSSPQGRKHGDTFYAAYLQIARDEGAVSLLKGEPKAKMSRARKVLAARASARAARAAA